LTQLNSTLAQATKDKEASIAGAERLYDQAVASLDAQYGSASSNGDTGVERATRRSAIKTRDAQYYAARDTSWANTLSGSINLGTTPWTVKAISAANAQAAYSTSRASAQAAHDAAMLDAIEDWQLSSRESLTDLLFTEGQSRETYNVATSNVYANWENGVGNLLGDKPKGTGYVPVRGFGEGGVVTMGGASAINTTRFEEGDDDPKDSGLKSDETATPRPILPPSEGPIVWLTPQQMLELERQHGLEMMDRFRRAYRVRDRNVGLFPGEMMNSLSQDRKSNGGGDSNLLPYKENSPTDASDPRYLRQPTLEETAELSRLLELEKQMWELASKHPENGDFLNLAARIRRERNEFLNRVTCESQPSRFASIGVLGGTCLVGAQSDTPFPGPADAISIIVFVFGTAGILTFGPSIPVISSEIRESADALSELVLQARRLGEQIDRVHDALKSYFEHMGKIDGKGSPDGGDPREWWRKWVEDAQKAIRIARDRWNDLKNCKQKDELKKYIDELEEALRNKAEEMRKLHE
jgi:hypothetical protein